MFANQSLRKKQLQIALKGNVVMLIWLGKQYLGQVDKVNTSGLTDAETENLRKFLSEQMKENI